MHNYLTSPLTGGLSLLNSAIKQAIVAYNIRKGAKQAYKELSLLTTRELNDIGLSRGDIWAVAYGKTSDYSAKINSNLEGHV